MARCEAFFAHMADEAKFDEENAEKGVVFYLGDQKVIEVKTVTDGAFKLNADAAPWSPEMPLAKFPVDFSLEEVTANEFWRRLEREMSCVVTWQAVAGNLYHVCPCWIPLHCGPLLHHPIAWR